MSIYKVPVNSEYTESSVKLKCIVHKIVWYIIKKTTLQNSMYNILPLKIMLAQLCMPTKIIHGISIEKLEGSTPNSSNYCRVLARHYNFIYVYSAWVFMVRLCYTCHHETFIKSLSSIYPSTCLSTYLPNYLLLQPSISVKECQVGFQI